VQGALARGDVKLAGVLADVEEVSLAGWRKAIAKSSLDIDHYVLNKWEVNAKLPWAVLDLGVGRQHLELELAKAMAG
jgi:hypothetical protein